METVHPIIEPAASLRRGWAIFAILLVGLSIAFLRVHKVADAREAGLPLRVVDQASLNFGQRKAGEKFDWPIRIRNDGERPITIARFATSCGCLSISPSSIVVGANSEVAITPTIVLGIPKIAGEKTTVLVEGFDEQGGLVMSLHVYGGVESSVTKGGGL